MKILIDKWRDGYLDEHLAQNCVRISVFAWITLRPVEELYFVREYRVRSVLNRTGDLKPHEIARKVLSRMAERDRNQKYISCGAGRVVETDANDVFQSPETVVFVAPCHPRCQERVVLPEIFTRRADIEMSDVYGAIRHAEHAVFPEVHQCPPPLDGLAGYHPMSGDDPDEAALNLLLTWAQDFFSRSLSLSEWSQVPVRGLPECEVGLPLRRKTPIPSRRRMSSKKLPPKPSTVLFGYGNYAKTVILPNVRKNLTLHRIHEIDPLQMPKQGPVRLDSSPMPRDTLGDYQCAIVAGFHHTHAPIASTALGAGLRVLLEKPIATDREQLAHLIAMLTVNPGKIYVGFQRRYSVFNKFLKEDIDLCPGQPFSYACTVYEEPLPARHWYRWPVSGSRILSNGCHWIDHFLFLNDFLPRTRIDVRRNRMGEIAVDIELVNGSVFYMLITDQGTSRLGLRNLIDLRSSDSTVRIIDDQFYRSESPTGVRVARRPRLDAHSVMYRHLSKLIRTESPGDQVEWVQRSAELALEADECLMSLSIEKH